MIILPCAAQSCHPGVEEKEWGSCGFLKGSIDEGGEPTCLCTSASMLMRAEALNCHILSAGAMHNIQCHGAICASIDSLSSK
jgi:hypothetical protein